MLGFR
jgi:hypothetical protein